MEVEESFDAILQQLHESAQRLPREKVVVNDPLRPEYSMLVHPDGRVQFKPSLSLVRYKIVADVIQQFITCGFTIKKVVDLGCSDKSFLMHGLLKMPAIREVVCLDQHLSKLVEEKLLFQADEDRRAQSLRVHLIEANILDAPRPVGWPQVVTLIEVIEHFQVADLPRLLWIVFCLMQPRVIIITTPNSDFNLTYPVPGGKRFRHSDHKFEWNTIEFQKFCGAVTEIYPNYSVVFDGCGYGASGHYCTQIAIFCVVSFRASLKRKPVGAQKYSIVEKILNLNETLSETSDAKTAHRTHAGPGCDACPVPFHSDDEQGRELNENERNVNLVLSELHTLAKQQTRLTEPKAKGESMMSEPETASPKREQEDTSSIVETEVDGRKVDAKLLDASLLKLSLQEPSDPSADLPTPESPSTTTPVQGDNPPVLFNRSAYFSDKYRIVQDITYEDVETLFTNALLQETGRFVWCCNSNNIYYPFTDKIEKFKGAWNFLEIFQSKEGKKPMKKRLMLPFTEMSNVSYKARKLMPRYTDEKDGACCEEHRNYKIFCQKCPFVYIKKIVLPKTENHPKVHTKYWYQNYVVYENSSATKLWFSLTLLKHYLGINDEKVVRKALSLTDNYTPVEIKDKKRTFEYYSCVIGEEEEKAEDNLEDDDDDDDDDDEGDSCPPSAGFGGSQDSLPSGRDESSRSTPPRSPTLPSESRGKHARGESVDSLDLLKTREASAQEEKDESPVQPTDHRVLDHELSRTLEVASSCAFKTVPHEASVMSSTEWAIACATAEAFSFTHNMNKSLLTKAILCGFTSLADIRAACANAVPADRYLAYDFPGPGERGSTPSKSHSFQRGTHDSSIAVDDASCDSYAPPPPSGVALLGPHLSAVKHSSLVKVSRTSEQAPPSSATLRAASCVNAGIKSSVAASLSARGPLTAASTASANPTSSAVRVTSSARSGLKLLAKSQPNVSLLGGVRAQSTAARTLPKGSITISTAGRTTSSVTRTTSAPRITHSATRPLVTSSARSASNTTRITPCPADGVARGIKPASHRLSQESLSRDAALRDARVPAAASTRSASKASINSRKLISTDKTSA